MVIAKQCPTYKYPQKFTGVFLEPITKYLLPDEKTVYFSSFLKLFFDKTIKAVDPTAVNRPVWIYAR